MSPFRESHRTADLVARARAGDQGAYDRLFALAADRVLLFLRVRIGPELRTRLEPMDVLQEAYAEALAAFPRFEYRGDDTFARWLCRIAENKVRGLAKYHGAQKRRSGAAPNVTQVLDRARADATGPVTAVARIEQREALEGALAELEEEEREAILMRFFEGADLAAMAERMGRSVSGVRRLLGRATNRLGARLSGEGA